MEAFFPNISAIPESLREEGLAEDIVERMTPKCVLLETPDIGTVGAIASEAKAPRGLSDVDRMIFATAVHHDLRVVTGDKPLARLCQRHKIDVRNIALALKELVLVGKISEQRCCQTLGNLAIREDYFLHPAKRITWKALKEYTFP